MLDIVDRENRRDWERRSYQRKKKRITDFLGGRCAWCGGTEDLEPDHIDASTKSFSVTANWNRRWEVLEAELKKCQALCRDCHKLKTFLCQETGGGWNKWTEVQHGKAWAYTGYGCRCEECKRAIAISRGRTWPPKQRKERLHGSYAMYKHGCRCDSCKQANREYMRQYNQKKTPSLPP